MIADSYDSESVRYESDTSQTKMIKLDVYFYTFFELLLFINKLNYNKL